jgi:hypothetical protein
LKEKLLVINVSSDEQREVILQYLDFLAIENYRFFNNLWFSYLFRALHKSLIYLISFVPLHVRLDFLFKNNNLP